MNRLDSDNPTQDLAHLRPNPSDEIDLGELLRNLMAQWRLIGSVTLIGAIASIGFALVQPKIYQIETLLTTPSLADISEIQEQTLVEIDQTIALEKTAETLVTNTLQAAVFADSELKKKISTDSDLSNEQLFSSVRSELTIERVENDLFAAGEDAQLKDIKITLNSPYPQAAAEYLTTLVNNSIAEAKRKLIADIEIAKAERGKGLIDQIKSETLAAKASREAEIARLTEANALKIKELEQRLTLLKLKAKAERETRIAQLEEAIATANSLNINDPVTWDDLRKKPLTAQIFNELDSQTKEEPLYFQGTRLLGAELEMLKNRTNDLLYVESAAEVQFQIATIAADPKLKALKAREDDTPYIENFEQLQMQLAKVQNQPTEFPNLQMAQITQPAIVPVNPIKPNKKLIVVAGTVLSGFLGLFIALLAIAIKPKD